MLTFPTLSTDLVCCRNIESTCFHSSVPRISLQNLGMRCLEDNRTLYYTWWIRWLLCSITNCIIIHWICSKICRKISIYLWCSPIEEYHNALYRLSCPCDWDLASRLLGNYDQKNHLCIWFLSTWLGPASIMNEMFPWLLYA